MSSRRSSSIRSIASLTILRAIALSLAALILAASFTRCSSSFCLSFSAYKNKEHKHLLLAHDRSEWLAIWQNNLTYSDWFLLQKLFLSLLLALLFSKAPFFFLLPFTFLPLHLFLYLLLSLYVRKNNISNRINIIIKEGKIKWRPILPSTFCLRISCFTSSFLILFSCTSSSRCNLASSFWE